MNHSEIASFIWGVVMLPQSSVGGRRVTPVGSKAGAVLRRRGLSVSPRFLWEYPVLCQNSALLK